MLFHKAAGDSWVTYLQVYGATQAVGPVYWPGYPPHCCHWPASAVLVLVLAELVVVELVLTLVEEETLVEDELELPPPPPPERVPVKVLLMGPHLMLE